MAEGDFGMEKGALKALLIKSKKEPVSCAIGKGKDAGAAYILLDKIKQPKALVTLLEKQFPDIKDPRHGTASVDVDDNPKLVVFRLNRPASGLPIRLLKLLKPVGFSKVRFEYEDGSAGEGLGDEEAEVAPAGAAPVAVVPPPFDAKALRDRLTALVQRMLKLIEAEPARRDVLAALAKQAQTALGTGDAAATGLAIDEFETALGATPPAAAAAPAPPPALSGHAKSSLIWMGTRNKMVADLDGLRARILDHYKAEGIAAELESRYDARVAPVLSGLDEALGKTLNLAIAAADPAQRGKLIADSRQIIQRYQSFVATSPVLAELDANPFVPMALAKTMTATLATLAKFLSA